MRRATLLSLLFAVLVAGMFFVVGAHGGQPRPGELDRVGLVERPDGFLSVWILSWSAHALVEQPLDLFDANVFHPTDNSLAYSETMLPLAPLYALLRAATGEPILALNLLLLLLTFLNLWGGYLLAEWITGRVDAALLAAVLFAFNGYAGAQRGHLQLQAMFLIPVALLFLFRWLEERRLRHVMLFAVCAAVQSLAAAYYGMMLLFAVTAMLAGYLAARRLRPGRGFFAGLAAGGLLAVVIVAPFAGAYLRFDDQRTRFNPNSSLSTVDLLTPARDSLLYAGLESAGGRPRNSEHRFFPGFLAFGLAAVGLAAAASGLAGRRGLYAVLLAVAAGVCLLLAFGPEAHGVALPFGWLRQHLPGVNGVRVPARLALAALLAVSQLAAVGYARLTARWRPAADRRLAAVAAAVLAVALLENASLTQYERYQVLDEAAVNRALAAAPDGAVVELPMALGVGAVGAIMESARMMLSTYDWKPRVNGYSGAYPRGYFLRAARLDRFPDPVALVTLCRLDVRYVVLRVDASESSRPFGRDDAARVLAALPPGATHSEHGGDHLVDLQGWRDAGGCSALPAGV